MMSDRDKEATARLCGYAKRARIKKATADRRDKKFGAKGWVSETDIMAALVDEVDREDMEREEKRKSDI